MIYRHCTTQHLDQAPANVLTWLGKIVGHGLLDLALDHAASLLKFHHIVGAVPELAPEGPQACRGSVRYIVSDGMLFVDKKE